jgi:glycolate oxidase
VEVALDFLSNEEVIQAARRNLDQGAWDYLVGGSESETSMRRNRLAFDRIAFRPRVLVDVSKIDTSTVFLGHMLRIPVILAPIGQLQRFTADGAVASAAAAGEFGIIQTVSSVTGPTLEETAAGGPGPKFFQLYVRGDLAWVKDMVDRVKAAGYAGFAITVDTAIYSRRERPMLGRSVATRIPRSFEDPRYQAQLTWDVADRIKEMASPLPFMVKGIGTAEDARLAVEHGVDVIWVSNHGGRQLDHGRGTLDTLPEIVEAAEGRADIILDGGVQRGSDVLKAIALGAKAVAVGKLQGWGAAAGGKDGVVRVLEILEDEIFSAMGLLGVNSVAALDSSYVCKAEPVTWPHEMSSWAHIPKEFVL